MFGSHAAELTVDQLEQVVESASGAISGATAVMLTAIRALDTAQVATADGARRLAEWMAGRFDLEASTARTLVDLARAEDSGLEGLLESGSITSDRAAAVVRLKNAGADDRILAEAWGRDLTGVRQMTSGHRRMSTAEESDSFRGRFLHLQPSLDESTWKVWGQLPGSDGRLVDKALQTAADSFPDDPDLTASQARADSLVSVASEWLSGEIGGHDMTAEIFIDAALAVSTDGEAGVTVVGGPRVGPTTLGEILCSGTVRINFADEYGRVSTSPSSRAIPSGIRARVLFRDGHRCVIAGCQSRSRLQPHHLIPYSQGGTHDPENLVTLCWFHHHVVVHQQGRKIDPDSPPQARRFVRQRHPTRAGP